MADNTIEFKPETLAAEPPKDIKDQFTQGPPEPPRQPTMEEIAEFRKKEQERMEKELPYMRIREEYNRLEMTLYEQGVMLGAIPVTNQEGKVIVPGLLGMELYLRQQEVLQQFAQYRDRLRQIADDMEKAQAEQTNQESSSVAD